MSQRGLTLIEVVVAAALVLGVVIAASDGVGTFTATTAQGARRDLAEQRVADEIESLGALAFCDPSRPVDEGADVISAVFPHADAARGTPQARFVPGAADGRPPGTFVTNVPDTDGVLTVAATFVAATACGWTPVTPVPGVYDAGRTAPLPSGALAVVVTYTCGRGRHHGHAERDAVIACAAGDLCGLQAPPTEGT